MGPKTVLLFGIVALVLIVISSEVVARDVAENLESMERTEAAAEVDGAKYPGGSYGGYPGGRYGGYPGGRYGGYPGGRYGGYPGGRYGGYPGGRYGGHCRYGCCGNGGYYGGGGCRCCVYPGEAAEAYVQDRPQN